MVRSRLFSLATIVQTVAVGWDAAPAAIGRGWVEGKGVAATGSCDDGGAGNGIAGAIDAKLGMVNGIAPPIAGGDEEGTGLGSIPFCNDIVLLEEPVS